VYGDAYAPTFDRVYDRLEIEWHQRAKVDYLRVAVVTRPSAELKTASSSLQLAKPLMNARQLKKFEAQSGKG